MVDMIEEKVVTVAAENAADFGFPAPSSLPTRTLNSAKEVKRREIKSVL